MEIAVTVVIVAAAAFFVSRRWIRSTRQTLQKASSGACGGDCAGCTLATVESQTHLDDSAPTPCPENRSSEPSSGSGR